LGGVTTHAVFLGLRGGRARRPPLGTVPSFNQLPRVRRWIARRLANSGAGTSRSWRCSLCSASCRRSDISSDLHVQRAGGSETRPGIIATGAVGASALFRKRQAISGRFREASPPASTPAAPPSRTLGAGRGRAPPDRRGGAAVLPSTIPLPTQRTTRCSAAQVARTLCLEVLASRKSRYRARPFRPAIGASRFAEP
jgi:hypothetical protein